MLTMYVQVCVYIGLFQTLQHLPCCDAGATVALPSSKLVNKDNINVDANVDIMSSPKTTNCSLTDESNGTVCQCAQSLLQHCADLRHGAASCLQCAKSANITMFDGTKCPSSIATAYCDDGCEMNYTWVGSLPPARNDIISIDEQNALCRNGSVMALAEDSISSESLRILGCNSDLLAGFYTGHGYYGDHLVHSANKTFTLLHGNSIALVVDCCEVYETAPAGCGYGGMTNIFWKLLKKQTGCQRDLIENELETLGFALPEIDQNNPVGGLYAFDLRKISSIIRPVIPVGFHQLYAVTVIYLTGLTIATAENRSLCSHQTWYLPGADTLYATSYHIQGDFHFPKNIPSPFDSGGTCGLSLSSEKLRLKTCSQIATFLYDKAFISGLSIVGCMVDCTASRLTGVDGAFVSVTLEVVEIDTKKSGLDKQHNGLDAAIMMWNTRGFNVTDEFQSTAGVGFHFAYFVQSVEDLSTTTNWTNYEGSNVSIPYDRLVPNLTAAMLAYKPPPPPPPASNRVASETVLIAGTVPFAVLLVIALVRRFLILRSRRRHGDDDVSLTTISNANNPYEDAVPHDDSTQSNA
eukprot:m.185817 g.185817  ORF g.185817 m.185817 type:complete len:579 (-) comp32244_c0_seq2:342-2078(-)